MTHERLLTWVLRGSGYVLIVAFTAVFMPTDLMADIHALIGLGEFPRTPVVDYLTRSVSGLYGFHGVLLLIIAGEPRRYVPIVRYIGIIDCIGGLMLLAIDLHAGLPWWWTIAEGPPLVATGILVLYLLKKLDWR